MRDERWTLEAQPFLRLQSWLSPAFPIGSYSYSHGLEWAVEARDVHDAKSLVEWLDADTRYGSIRNEALFFNEAWRSVMSRDGTRLLDIAELAAALRGTAEFALESSQQGTACLAILRRVWPDPLLDSLAQSLQERRIAPVPAIVLGARSASQGLAAEVALPAFLQSYVGNLVSAAVRLIPLGQTAGQLVIAELEAAVLATSLAARGCSIEDLGSAAFRVDLASMAHETQYTRLFRS
jgi:urease accessory protein